MPTRKAEAVWEGTLREGHGSMKVGSGAFEGKYSFTTRFEEEAGTNPEELIGAAHAGCFSMALSARLANAGFTPTRIHTSAQVHLERGEAGFGISKIVLQTEAQVPGIDEAAFMEHANDAKANCPVSKALAAVPIELNARLI